MQPYAFTPSTIHQRLRRRAGPRAAAHRPVHARYLAVAADAAGRAVAAVAAAARGRSEGIGHQARADWAAAGVRPGVPGGWPATGARPARPGQRGARAG